MKERLQICIEGNVLADPEAVKRFTDQLRSLIDNVDLVFIDPQRSLPPLKHWQPVANWVDRVLPWPRVPSGITDQLAWEIYYRQKADAAATRLAIARLAIEAMLEDVRLYGHDALCADEIALLRRVLAQISESPRTPYEPPPQT